MGLGRRDISYRPASRFRSRCLFKLVNTSRLTTRIFWCQHFPIITLDKDIEYLITRTYSHEQPTDIMSGSNISTLATQVSALTHEISSYLSANDLTFPSFAEDAPQQDLGIIEPSVERATLRCHKRLYRAARASPRTWSAPRHNGT